MKLRPDDLGIWFSEIDVNVLSAPDAANLAQFEVASDAGLEKMVMEWIAPRFAANNDVTKRQMRELLSLSDQWTDAEIERVFSQFACPAKGRLEVRPLLLVLQKVFLY